MTTTTVAPVARTPKRKPVRKANYHAINAVYGTLELTVGELQQIYTNGPLFIGNNFDNFDSANSSKLNPIRVMGPINFDGNVSTLVLAGKSVNHLSTPEGVVLNRPRSTTSPSGLSVQ